MASTAWYEFTAMRSPLCDLEHTQDQFLRKIVKKGPLLIASGKREMVRKLARLGVVFIVPSRTLRRRGTGVADIDEAVLRRKLWAVHATPEGVEYVNRRPVHNLWKNCG